jgi:hypothetical protein
MRRYLAILTAATVPLAANAQYNYQPQYNPPTIVAPPNQAPVVVPPTVIMPAAAPMSSKTSCKRNVINLFLVSWETHSGDCHP